jgi:hypothetical protein
MDSLFTQDPLMTLQTTLELCTLLMTLLYITRLMRAENAESITPPRSSASYSAQFSEVSKDHPLRSFFNVGRLISVPKRSLAAQRLAR